MEILVSVIYDGKNIVTKMLWWNWKIVLILLHMKPDLFWFVKCLTSTDGAGGLEKDTVNFVASLETALNVIPEKKRRLKHQHSCPFKRIKKLQTSFHYFSMHYFNYNKDLLPRTTRSSGKLRHPCIYKVRNVWKRPFYYSCAIFNQI